MRGTRTWAKMFRYCQIKLNGSVVAQGEGRRAQGAGRRAKGAWRRAKGAWRRVQGAWGRAQGEGRRNSLP